MNPVELLGRYLNAKGQIALHLSQERRPLTQYDIDYLPRFRQIPLEDRQWLTGQDVDVYVPIHSKEKWIGLFALGAKNTGERYYDEDLLLLSTLADQSAVALENARIFADLYRINQELEHARTELEIANQQLREDELKSSFVM
jgi:GAF domain-containing protein